MNKEHVKGATDTVVGKTKEAAGHVTGNKRLETEGKVDQVEGAAHNTAGDAKEAGKKAIDAVKGAPSKHQERRPGRMGPLISNDGRVFVRSNQSLGQQDHCVEDGSTMNSTSLLGLFVATVTWIPIRTHPIAGRSGVLENKMTSRTAHTELYIPLHQDGLAANPTAEVQNFMRSIALYRPGRKPKETQGQETQGQDGT